MTSRLTSELAVAQAGNRFDLVLMAAQRTRDILHGSAPRVTPQKTASSTALLEIENGKYTKQEYLDKVQANLAKKTKGQRDEYFPT